MQTNQIIATAEAENSGALYETGLTSEKHHYLIDEPELHGGKNLAPSPIDYLCASLASCKVITLRMYANRKGWNVSLIKVRVKLLKVVGGVKHTFSCELEIQGHVTEQQRVRMLDISQVCPVQKLLSRSAEITTILTEVIR